MRAAHRVRKPLDIATLLALVRPLPRRRPERRSPRWLARTPTASGSLVSRMTKPSASLQAVGAMQSPLAFATTSGRAQAPAPSTSKRSNRAILPSRATASVHRLGTSARSLMGDIWIARARTPAVDTEPHAVADADRRCIGSADVPHPSRPPWIRRWPQRHRHLPGRARHACRTVLRRPNLTTTPAAYTPVGARPRATSS
jgi:hypothetical protein